MQHPHDFEERDGALDQLFAELPRVAAPAAGQVDEIVEQLRREGFFYRSRRGVWWTLGAVAAVLLFAAGVVAGSRYSRRDSLEEMLARRDLAVSERVLLLQRAGSAYVRAAQSYADATAHVDSSAVEVASRVLLGAANAVARNNLDGGLSARLSNVFQHTSNPAPVRKAVQWF